MSDPRKLPNKNSAGRDRVAEAIFIQMVVGNQAGQYEPSYFADKARRAAEVFYPDDLPLPSVPMNKAV